MNYNKMAREAIEREDTICFDVCVEHGQIFGNVRNTRWLRDAVADAIAEDPEGYLADARKADADAQDSLCPECGLGDCTCQADWANSINDTVREALQ